MALQRFNGSRPDKMITLGGTNNKTGEENPTQIKGYFLGSQTRPDEMKESGESYIHSFRTADGVVGVWGKTNLDNQLKGAPTGVWFEVEFVGMTKIKGRQPMYTYELSVDFDRKIEVISAAKTVDDESVQQTGARLSAERQAKVDSMLKQKTKN